MISFYLYLSCISSSQISVFNPDSAFENYEYNRLIAFNYDHTKIDPMIYENIEDVYYENAFYEDIVFNVTVGKKGNRDVQIPVVYTKYDIEYTHLSGEELSDSYAVYIVLPYDELDRYSLLISNLVEGYVDFSNHQIPFIGIGHSKNVNSPVILSSWDISKYVYSKTYKTFVSAKMVNTLTDEVFDIKRSYQNVGVPTVYMPKKYMEIEDKIEFEFMLNNLYPINNPEGLRISYTAAGEEVYFAMPYNFEPSYDGVYELTIYANNPIEMAEKLEKLGLTVVRPAVDYVEISLNHVLYLLYTVISIIIIFILYLVSYAVLSKIYSFKTKDYTVFRTLGVSKGNMKFIVIMEIVSISLVANAAGILTMYGLYNGLNLEFLSIVSFNNVYITLLSFVIAMVFSYYIANKFNNGLFKNSVNSTFKSEV